MKTKVSILDRKFGLLWYKTGFVVYYEHWYRVPAPLQPGIWERVTIFGFDFDSMRFWRPK